MLYNCLRNPSSRVWYPLLADTGVLMVDLQKVQKLNLKKQIEILEERGKVKSSRSSAKERVQGQPGLYETLSQTSKQANNKTTKLTNPFYLFESHCGSGWGPNNFHSSAKSDVVTKLSHGQGFMDQTAKPWQGHPRL